MTMLSENIKRIRKKQGLSQEELATRLNVVRQTVSKWETGLSVPDADLLISLSEALGTPVSVLLGETVEEPRPDDIKAISEELERINLQLARAKEARRKRWFWFFLALCAVIAATALVLFLIKSPYLGWDDSDPETAVIITVFHAFEFAFVRLAPFVLIGAAIGAILTRPRR